MIMTMGGMNTCTRGYVKSTSFLLSNISWRISSATRHSGCKALKTTRLRCSVYNIIGSATLILNEPHSRASHVASFGVVVHPDFQRKGLGKQLIAALEQIARDKAIKKIE